MAQPVNLERTFYYCAAEKKPLEIRNVVIAQNMSGICQSIPFAYVWRIVFFFMKIFIFCSFYSSMIEAGAHAYKSNFGKIRTITSNLVLCRFYQNCGSFVEIDLHTPRPLVIDNHPPLQLCTSIALICHNSSQSSMGEPKRSGIWYYFL